MSTGERISRKRQEYGWSQTHLARLVGVNVKSVKDWEASVSLPSAKTLIALSQLFSVSTDYLLCIDHRAMISIEHLSPDDQHRVKAFIQMLMNLHLPSQY
ncbi:MAG: helix-turn-helix transcriptional regulator [Clostridia bacterium]|nr:helix-turn-helix transcriptional regulator [Clostridia bacterium]